MTKPSYLTFPSWGGTGGTVLSSVIVSTAAANTSLDSGESVTGTLASKWKPPQGLAIPNRDRLFLTLLDATAPEKSLVGSVLFDIRRFPLLRRVLTFFMLQGWVLGDLSVTASRGPFGDRLAGGTGGIWLLMSLLLSARIGTDCPSIERLTLTTFHPSRCFPEERTHGHDSKVAPGTPVGAVRTGLREKIELVSAMPKRKLENNAQDWRLPA